MSDTDLPPRLLELATLGALALILAWACLGIVAILHRTTLARLWLAREDPRVLASFRIVFATMVLVSVNTMVPELRFLLSDEGFYTTDVAQSLLAGPQFAGFGDGITAGEVRGFFDVRAFFQWLRGPTYSLLLFGSSPSAVWAHLVAVDLALLALLLGWHTKYTKWLAWLLYLSLLGRNQAMWAGDEPVILSLFPLLCLSRCGSAFSLDARREPADVRPTIPSWPRYLIVWKTVLIYWAAGVCKSGPSWSSGDAVYYALLFDDLARWPHHTWLAHVPHLWLQGATWATLILELGFPLVLAGMLGRALVQHPAEPLKPKARRLVQVFGVLSLVLAGFAVFAYASLFRTIPDPTDDSRLWLAQLTTAVANVLVGWVAHKALQHAVPGSAFVFKWLLGRRFWVGLSLVLQLQLTLLCNIGMFNPLMCAAALAFFRWHELVGAAQSIATKLRLGWMHSQSPARAVTEGEVGTAKWPATRKLPAAVVWASATMVAAAVVIHSLRPVETTKPPLVPLWPFEPIGTVNEGVLLAATFAATVGWRLDRGRRLDSRWLPLPMLIAGVALRTEAPQLEATLLGLTALAVSTAMACRLGGQRPDRRTFSRAPAVWLATLCLYHASAELAWVASRARGEGSESLRTAVRTTIRPWMHTLHVGFVWRMFSPDVRRTNQYLRVLVTDAQGDIYDLRQGIYACLMHPEDEVLCDKVYPRPNWLRERTRKIRRRALHHDWIARWHARWVCRDWALRHAGVLPKQVDLVRVNVTMPSPEEAANEGLADPAERLQSHGEQRIIYTALCHEHPTAQLSAEIRRRHGFTPVAPETIRPWHKQRCSKWSQALRRAGLTPSFRCADRAEHEKLR